MRNYIFTVGGSTKYYGQLGLRDTFKRSKRYSLKFKLQTLKNDLVTAWQRAWYGYSNASCKYKDVLLILIAFLCAIIMVICIIGAVEWGIAPQAKMVEYVLSKLQN